MFKSKRLIVMAVLIFFIAALSPNSAYAGNPFNLVIEKLDKIIGILEENLLPVPCDPVPCDPVPCDPGFCAFTCNGNLSEGGRWCDNLDGTVKDMTTGIIWLQDAGWGGQKPWRSPSNYDDVYMRTGILQGSTPDAGLSDGSQKGDWRMPTKSELVAITEGIEPVSPSAMYFFTNVQSRYWSSGSYGWSHPQLGMFVDLNTGASWSEKFGSLSVWPVRSSFR